MKCPLKSMGRLLLTTPRCGLGPSFRPLKQMQNVFSFMLLNTALFSKQGTNSYVSVSVILSSYEVIPALLSVNLL